MTSSTQPPDPPLGEQQPGAPQPFFTPQPSVPPPAYGYGGPAPYPAGKTNTNAIVSLVTSILSWVACPIVLAIVGLVTGTIGRRQIRESNGAESGDGLAIAGIIISILNIALIGLLVALILAVTLLGKNASSKFSSVASAIS